MADVTAVAAAAYRTYDRDGEYRRLRAELLPMAGQITRLQFEL